VVRPAARGQLHVALRSPDFLHRCKRKLPAAAELVSLLAVNLGLFYVASRLIGDRDDFPVGEGLFFACLGTLILWLYDAYSRWPTSASQARSASVTL
jgi:hypothetical protein